MEIEGKDPIPMKMMKPKLVIVTNLDPRFPIDVNSENRIKTIKFSPYSKRKDRQKA